ncbi:MAG: hypothetical protein PHV23_01085 [Candidatus Gracilibacteria bacterium]|nr:hypothetical protein [Candidatus Gracilibacteria bacterium]
MKKYFFIVLIVFLVFSCGNNSINIENENIGQNEILNIEANVEGVGIVKVENMDEIKLDELQNIITNSGGENNNLSPETTFDIIDTNLELNNTGNTESVSINNGNINLITDGNQEFDSVDIGKTIDLENVTVKGSFSN